MMITVGSTGWLEAAGRGRGRRLLELEREQFRCLARSDTKFTKITRSDN
jgi:hypothetical protein